MGYAIETNQLTKIFRKGRGLWSLFNNGRWDGKGTRALDGVDLQVEEGEIFALLGPNGAGKTTLIKILCSLVLPDGGEARIFGHDVVREPKKVKPAISLTVGEERSFYWRLTGRQNLEFFAALYNLSKKEARRKIGEAAAALGIEDLDKRYQEYSTGNRHRLALARGFLNGARLIFMDEPTRSLDPNASLALRDLIRRQVREGSGKTFFFTTHQTGEAEALADRIAILDQGKLRACGTLEALRRLTGESSLDRIFYRLTERP
ncbi:MAG: ABC transporter ATP-binding protein [Deltaproteobacteria bacterium]|nr:ABC transporter ATP-binding protein [Deltaproteobacteria bacterium]